MEARTVNNLPPAAPHDDAVRCLLAIELSKKSWIVAVNTPLSDKISRYTLEACDWKGLLELCERIRTRVARLDAFYSLLGQPAVKGKPPCCRKGHRNSASTAFASVRSSVSKPSTNQP
jgi:hypothetical protein